VTGWVSADWIGLDLGTSVHGSEPHPLTQIHERRGKAQLKKFRKQSFSMYNVASAAEAAVDFSLLTARLEAAPFQNGSQYESFRRLSSGRAATIRRLQLLRDVLNRGLLGCTELVIRKLRLLSTSSTHLLLCFSLRCASRSSSSSLSRFSLCSFVTSFFS
jgi:hypothetical protein